MSAEKRDSPRTGCPYRRAEAHSRILLSPTGLDWDSDFGEEGSSEYDSWMQLMWSGVVTRLSTLWDYLSDAFLPRETQQEYFRHGQALAHFQLTARYSNRQTLLENVDQSLEELRKDRVALKENEAELGDDATEDEEKAEGREDLREELASVEALITGLRTSRREMRRRINQDKALGVYWDTKPLLDELQKGAPVSQHG